MKKTMIFAAFAALVSFASCQKEDITDSGTDKTSSPVFTASISGATKTTINVTDGKVAWEATDEITVTDASTASAVYSIESIDATTGKATFVIKTGETALGAGPYTATYGTEPAATQTYSATAGKLYMTAPATSNNNFIFTVQCGLMKLNLTKPGVSVKSIAVTGTPTGSGKSETTYTLTCTEAQSINYAKDFHIALPAGSYTKIEIMNTDGKVCTLNSTNGVTVNANHIKPVTFDWNKLDFKFTYPDEVVIDFDFTTGNNPFGFTDPGVANEDATNGETYPYLYNFTDAKSGQPVSTVLDFTICRSSTASTHYYYKSMTGNGYGTGYVLVFDASNSWIKIPAIENHYLQAVTASIGNGYAKDLGVKETPASTSSVGIMSIPKATADGPVAKTMQFYTNGNDGSNTDLQGNTTQISTGYTLHLRSANGTRIAHLTLKYTKTLPAKQQ